MKISLKVIATVLALSLASVVTARAEIVDLRATLASAQVVPPRNSRGNGTVVASYDTATRRLIYVINYGDLTGRPSAAHFHGPAQEGQNARVALRVRGRLANPIHGAARLTRGQESDLLAGRWYFDIHTRANRGGEIRGQLRK